MAGKEDKTERGGIQVIARAAAILRALKDEPSGLSLGQIAERVGLPRSTVQRITGALAAERLLMSNPRGGGLRLGPELGALAEAARYNVVERCRPILAALTQETGETTDLSVMRDGAMVFLDQVPGLHRLRTVSSVGEVFPLTSTANGRACLALMTPAEARAAAEAELRGRPGGALAQALARVDEVRRDGVAEDLDEHTPGISALGFAFREWGGDLHAISVPIPSMRFEACREEVTEALLRARDKVAELNIAQTG